MEPMTYVQEISEMEAAALHRAGIPENMRIVERDEVLYWQKVYSRPEGGCLYVPEEFDPIERYAPKIESTVLYGLDLFAGCGGFSLGMECGGVDMVCAVEWDACASLTYLENLGRSDTRIAFDSDETERTFWKMHAKFDRSAVLPSYGFTPTDSWMGSAWRAQRGEPGRGCRGFFNGDIRSISGEMLLELAGVDHFDVICGGPPCQGMSVGSSKRGVDDPRNAMLWEYMRLVEELEPDVFVMENVPPILTIGNGVFFNRICEIGNAAGYSVAANVLNAAHYGVPQYRRRAFIMGNKGNKPIAFPLPTTWAMGSDADGRRWNMLAGDLEDEGLTAPMEEDPLTLFSEAT